MKNIFIAIGCLVIIVACDASPLEIGKDPSGVGGSSSSISSSGASTSSSSTSSSSGQGNGGSDPGLSCDPCENVNGARLIRQRTKTIGSDGLVLYNGISSIYDTLKQTVCVAMTAEDGVTRCMPPSYAIVSVGSFFADATCSIAVGHVFAAACNPVVPLYAGEIVAGQSCADPNKYIVYTTKSEYTSSVYFKDNGTCMSAPPSTIYKYYSLGNKIPPSEFVELNVQTIP